MRNWSFVLCALLVYGALSFGARGKDEKQIAATQGSNEHAVSMKSVKYSPASLNIKVGETVIWTNNDDHDHTVVADDGSFKSDNIGRGQTFKHTFDKKGKFKYACSYHPRMKGTINVTN